MRVLHWRWYPDRSRPVEVEVRQLVAQFLHVVGRQGAAVAGDGAAHGQGRRRDVQQHDQVRRRHRTLLGEGKQSMHFNFYQPLSLTWLTL